MSTRIHTLSLALAAALATLAAPAQALGTGDLAFTAFNADEDGFAMLSFVDIAAGTTLYFGDNEWTGSAFNTGESYLSWTTTSTVAAGTVVRFAAVDKTTLSASTGTLVREAVSGSTNYGLSSSNETLYAYQGSSASAPSTFIAAITNGSFSVDGPLTGTGLSEGSSNAINLTTLATTATPDFAEYTGPRSGLSSFSAYQPLIANLANWTVDTTNGTYTSTVPDTTAFTVSTVPEPEGWAMMAAGLGLLGLCGSRRRLPR